MPLVSFAGAPSQHPVSSSAIIQEKLISRIDPLPWALGFSKSGRNPRAASFAQARHTLAGVRRLEGSRVREVRRAPGGVRIHEAGARS